MLFFQKVSLFNVAISLRAKSEGTPIKVARGFYG